MERRKNSLETEFLDHYVPSRYFNKFSTWFGNESKALLVFQNSETILSLSLQSFSTAIQKRTVKILKIFVPK